jgi:formylglycine-generating enzyme required for sulfatase activity
MIPGRVNRLFMGIVWLVLAGVARAQPALEPPPADPAASKTAASAALVTGRVVAVYVSERSLPGGESDLHYALEVHVAKVVKGTGIAPGSTIFVKTWRVGKRPEGWSGIEGQKQIPDRGDIVEISMTSSAGLHEATIPDGIRVELAGKSTSESTGLDLVLVEAGEFLMGSPANEPNRRPDELQHRVSISRRFYMGAHEVTQFEFKQVMNSKPSAFAIGGKSKDKVVKVITDRYPVESVTWFDAVEFCNRLSRLDGLEPYYKITEPKRDVSNLVAATVEVIGGTGYRLPTEAEWEYSCRAGTVTPFHYGTESSTATSNVKALMVAVGYGASPKFKELGRTTRVESFPSNAWGLFDMHGNAAEWCEDWYDPTFYKGIPVQDPKGPAEGTHKVMRGGSWLVNDASCRSASRFYHLPREAIYYGGFRVARTP